MECEAKNEKKKTKDHNSITPYQVQHARRAGETVRALSSPWPGGEFWHRFWYHFGITFSLIFRFYHNMRQPPECLHTKHFGGLSTFKISHFLIKYRSKFHIFFDASFWTSFFEILVRLGAKKLDFGSPLAPSWAQNGAQNRPSGAPNLKFLGRLSAFCRNMEPTCSQGHFLSAPWHRFGWFWIDLAWILIDFCISVGAFRTHACNKISRLLTSPDTKRIDSKRQEHTDIC